MKNPDAIVRVLLVEDNPGDELLMLRELKKSGYEVISKRVETEAAYTLELEERIYDLVICDYRLPHFSAMKALEIWQASGLDIPFLIVSGFVGEEAVIGILVKGAHDFISKENFSRLPLAVKRELRQAGQRMQFKLDLEQAYQATIEAWGKALELRDIDTEGHTLRVTDMTLLLARRMGISKQELKDIQRGALLHDIGKMGVPDAVLLKPGALTQKEREEISKHPEFAYNLLSPIKFLGGALDIPYCHHEKWDGTGYPRGLKGDAIPLAARIFAVVDVYDAMTSNRVYRSGMPRGAVLQFIQEQSGKYFDPAVVDSFLEMMEAK